MANNGLISVEVTFKLHCEAILWKNVRTTWIAVYHVEGV